MSQRAILRPDLLHAMEHVTAANEQKGGTFAVSAEYTWKCHGPDRIGRRLGFVAAVEKDVVVITVFDEL